MGGRGETLQVGEMLKIINGEAGKIELHVCDWESWNDMG